MAAAHSGICPIRCDRILWKSTVEPDPNSENDESEAYHPKARTRVGQFFANFRMRYRKTSYSSSTSSEVSSHGHAPMPSRDEVSTPSNYSPSLMSTPVGGKDLMLSSRFVSPESSAPEVGGLGSVDQAQSEGKILPKYRGPSQAGIALTKPTSTTPKDDQSQVVRNGPPRWRFLPFFRGDLSQGTVSTDPTPTPGEPAEMTASSTIHRPRKGDIICLGYDSLDDRAMRRLEGRSDHRPVIGSFAIYL